MSKKIVMLDGIMTYGHDEKGREIADFQNVEPGVVVEPFVGRCKVQRVRDGHLYVTRLPKRIRNRPLFLPTAKLPSVISPQNASVM